MIESTAMVPTAPPALPPSARLAAWIGIAAALAAVVADLALQFTTDRSHILTPQHLYLLDVSPDRVLIGHYLGVVAILVEIAGLWPVYWALRPAGGFVAAAYGLLNAFCFALGAAFHATVAFLSLIVRAEPQASPETAAALAGLVKASGAYRAGLIVPVALGMIAGAALFAILVGRGRTAFPRWMAALSPPPIAVALFALGRAVPALGLVIFPAGLNIATLIFFLLCAAILPRRTTMETSRGG